MKALAVVGAALLLLVLVVIAIVAAIFQTLASAEILLPCGLDTAVLIDDAGEEMEAEATTQISDRLSLTATQEANARLILGVGQDRDASTEQLVAMLARSMARSDLLSRTGSNGLLGLDPLAFPAIDVTDKLASIGAYLAADAPPFDELLDGDWRPEAETIVARWGNSTINPITCTGPGGGVVVDAEDIVTVRGIQIHASIAPNLAALLAAAEADGVTLSGWGWRSHQRQHELRELNGCGRRVNGRLVDDGSWTHTADENPSNWVPSSSCRTPTARPGFSNHESGLAVDFTYNGRVIGSRSGPAWRWLAANAGRYGFINLPSEPWHWSTDGR